MLEKQRELEFRNGTALKWMSATTSVFYVSCLFVSDCRVSDSEHTDFSHLMLSFFNVLNFYFDN